MTKYKQSCTYCGVIPIINGLNPRIVILPMTVGPTLPTPGPPARQWFTPGNKVLFRYAEINWALESWRGYFSWHRFR